MKHDWQGKVGSNVRFDDVYSGLHSLWVRQFWAYANLDRFSSSSSAQAPHFLREKDVQIQLPCSDFEFLNEIPAATEMLKGGYHPSITKIPGIQIGSLDPCAYFIRYARLLSL
jgi:hypothetical protein